MPRLVLVGLVLLCSLRATSSDAQDTSVVAQSDSSLCEGRRITRIDLESGVRTVEEGVPGIVRPIARLAVGGPRTRERALLPYLLVKEGSVCSEARRRESERLLRGLKYVASARLRPEVDGEGVRIVVEATDDLRPIVGMTLDDNTPESLKLGTVNLGGTGTLVHGEWEDGGAFRDAFALRATNPTLFGRRATWTVAMDRRPLGNRTFLALSEPYLTRFQTIAWEVSLRDETVYVPLSLNTADRAVWQTTWRTLNAGALSRISLGNAQLLAGGMFTYERIAPADSGILVTPGGFVAPTDPALADRYVTQSGSRLGLIGGIRALSFTTAEGLQTVEGVHDVARGIQAAAVVGRGVSGGDDHPFIATEVYAGAGGPRSFASARVTAERRSSDAQRAARLASGRAAWYWRVSDRQTQEVSAEFAGIWREDVPAALFLDDRLTGPRGYDGAVASGSRLLVGRFERRLRFGGFGRSIGFAGAAFADAAKLWSGDAPLGVTTDPLFSAGVGFLVALPRNSRKTIRLDASYPITKSNGAGGFDIRMTVTNAGRTYWQEPAAFQRSRIVPMLRSLLGWF